MLQRTRPLALFFADIVGYSRMMHADEARAVAALQYWRRLVRSCVEGHGGKVIEFTGDAAFAHFEQAEAAVAAGLAIQRVLTEPHGPEEPPPPQCRIGIHWGEVSEQEGRYYGDALNIAARLEPLALPGAVAVSGAVLAQLPHPEALERHAFGKPPLKNIEEEVEVHQLFPHRPPPRVRIRLQTRRLLNLTRQHPVLAGTLATLAIAGLFVLLLRLLPPPLPQGVKLELGEIRNRSPDRLPAYYTIGVADEIRHQLERIPNLYLARPEEGARAPLVLEGQIEQRDGQIHLHYQLRHRGKSRVLASGELEGPLSRMLELQRQLARRIARQLADRYHLAWLPPRDTRAPVSPEAYQYYLQGKSYLERSKEKGVLSSAETLFLRALNLEPDYADALAGLCRTYWQEYEEQHQPELSEKAEQACRKALKLDPRSAMVHSALGAVLLGRGKWQQAAQAYEEAIRLDPRLTEAYLGLADTYAELGRPDLAEQTYRRAIQLQNISWSAWTAYGAYLARRGEYRKAIQAFRKVVELTPDDSQAYSRLGALYMLTGQFGEAAEILTRGARIRPSPDLLSNTGTMYYYNHDYPQAVHMYRKAVEKAPKMCELRLNLADALMQIPEQKEEARKTYREALNLCRRDVEINPRNYVTHLLLGRILSMLGDRQGALQHLRQARALGGDDPSVAFNAATIHAVLGNETAVQNELEKALELGYPKQIIAAEPLLDPYRSRPWFQAIAQSP